ncbi:MAG TPA: C-terminal binding protein [Thermoguttaceae bacterium]|nr:C-terminal binding protein [Thermoguttaceae bacterium]
MMAKYKVAVTDYTFDDLDIERAILEPLGCEIVGQKIGRTPEQLVPLVEDADYVITQFAPVNAQVIVAMQKCKLIVRYGIGVDNVDLAVAAAKGIPVCNVPDYCIDEVADHALAMILDLTRKITIHAVHVKAGGWGMAVPLSAMHALKNLTVGVVGFGRIGREVVQRLQAFKCKILVFDPAVDAAAIQAAGCVESTLEELLSASDLVTLHCPSNPTTQYMINARSIAKMKPGAMLVNTSRGTLVKTDDLAAALQSGRLSAAALDVTDPEPIPPDHPIVKLDNCVINAHLASVGVPSFRKLRRTAAEIVAMAIHGQKLPNVVNGVNS